MKPSAGSRPEMFVVSRLAHCRDPANGARKRLDAWRTLLPGLQVVPSDAPPPGGWPGGDARFCVDLTGAKAPEIVRAWRNFRSRRPAVFVQDSQARFFWTELRFHFGRRDFIRALKASLSLARGASREYLCRLLFREVGYISEEDAGFLWPPGLPVVAIPAMIVDAPPAEASPVHCMRTLGVIANFAYSPNADGTRALLASRVLGDCMRRNGLKCRLLGHGATEFLASLPAEAAELVDQRGSGPFADVQEVIKEVDAVVSPAMYGSGVKNKILEAAAAGKLCFVWNGFRSEYAYDPELTLYFGGATDLARLLDRVRAVVDEWPDQDARTLQPRMQLLRIL
ncbi:MAG: hypothetical protein WB493_05825 [Anaeromyxobacteraceae bacterium]